MKNARFWAALTALCAAILFSAAAAQRNAAPPKSKDDTLIGFVSDSICGVKGATLAHADCMRQCLDKGADIVIVADDTHDIVHIENPADLKSHFAQRVVLTGYWNSGQFHVISIRSI
jgi:hypothetical protein